MEGIAYTAALLLAAVFGWAGAAKLGDRPGTTSSFAALGLPAAGTLAVAVPLVELALAVGLVATPGWAAAVALALLAAFTTLLARAMAAGLDVGCGCFGTARRQPVSAVELVRNALLASAALIALGSDGPEVPALADIVLVTTAAAAGAVVLALGELRRRTGGVVRMELP